MKTQVANTSLLARVPLFANLGPEQLERLEACLRPRRYGRGEVVFLTGDPGTSLCVIEEGRVKLGFTSDQGREVILDVFGPGEFFGELALLDGEPRSADAVAVEPTQMAHLTREHFIQFLRDEHEAALELLAVLSRRLRRDARLVQDAAFLDVPARLARTLLRLSEPINSEQSRTPRMTQSDLAGMVGTTRETLNKWLRFYEDQGLIRLEHGRVAILRAEDLHKRIY